MFSFSSNKKVMNLIALLRRLDGRPTLPRLAGPLQFRSFQHDFVPRDPNTKPKKYKYPPYYDPYGPRSPPSEKIVQLAERIAALPTEERQQIPTALRARFALPGVEVIEGGGMHVGAGGEGDKQKVEDEKVEKTAFDVKLEKFDAATKLKVIKEVREYTKLGLKEAKDLVEKAPSVLKKGVTKEEAETIIEKIKAAGGVAVME